MPQPRPRALRDGSAMKTEFRVNNFDLLRIIAAAQVVVIHSFSHLHIAHPWGWSAIDAFPGVPIFFVISGFLISASYERSTDLASYSRNRILRIVPGLWCVIILTVPVAMAFGYHFFNVRAAAWFVSQLAGLIFTPGFLKSFGFGSYNGALWTIPIELQFYFVLPLLYLATKRAPKRRTQVFVAVWAVFVVIAFIYATKSAPLAENTIESTGHKLFRYSFVPHIYMFLAGVLLQRFKAHQSRWMAGRGAYWLAAYLVVHFSLPEGSAAKYIASTLMLSVTVISIAYTLPGIAHRVLNGNDISYGVYIYHGLILNIMVERGYHGRIAYVPLVMLLTAIVAFASWRLVEQPFLRRKRGSIKAAPPPLAM